MVQLKNKIEEKSVTKPGLSKPEVERILPPEKKVEIEKPPAPEAEKSAPPSEVAEKPVVAPPPVAPPTPARPPKSETLVKIEKILEEDLEEIYFQMPPEQRSIFKEKGEETASRIERLIAAGKAIAKKILKLIKNWLELIPGVNRFFLEQEAKIKTDKIMALAEREKKRRL